MKLYKLYETLMSEAENPSCISKFGQELFGDELGGKERNTPIENNYLELIKDFTDNMYGEETTNQFINALQNLKSCMSQYPDVLVPDSSTVYRGTMIPLTYFINNKQPIDIQGPNNYTYKANSPVQSWSISYETASNFGSHETLNEISNSIGHVETSSREDLTRLLQTLVNEDMRLSFVFAYKTSPDEFIFKSQAFSKLSKMEHEVELIRFTNKPIHVTAYFNDNEDNHLSEDSINLIEAINKAISIR